MAIQCPRPGHLDSAATPALLHEQVTADVRRAARLIDTGLRAFAA
jgi:hypothetical protein